MRGRHNRQQIAGHHNTQAIQVTGLQSCDPVRRTPWGTIIVAEEAGATGGLYELIDPVSINAPINVSDRAAGTTSDPNHLVKRKAVASLSFESFAIGHDGTMIYGDELGLSNGNAGGSLYKFVPTVPYLGTGQPPITQPQLSPLASGTVFGLRVAANGSSNWGQGAEVGKGRWIAIDTAAAGVVDANGNIILRNAQALQKFTGYYRPEDMDVDPIAASNGVLRACWANTGRLNFAGGRRRLAPKIRRGDRDVECTVIHGACHSRFARSVMQYVADLAFTNQCSRS